MTNSQPHIRKPTPGQLKYLKDLAIAAGESFGYPETFGQASAEIKRLLKAKRTSVAERRRETWQLREDFSTGCGDAAAISPEEIGGYGANCRWLHQTRD
jgi:hypothetical protein